MNKKSKKKMNKETQEKLKYCLFNLTEGSDRGDAELLTKFFEEKDFIKFNADKQQWIRYIGGRWVQDTENSLRDKAQEFFIKSYKELKTNLDFIHEKEAGEDLKKTLNKKIISLGTVNKIENILRNASILESIRISENRNGVHRKQVFDTHPHLINLLNGTYDLKKHKLKDHNHKDMITFRTDFNYVEGAECPNFEKFIDDIFCKDQELIKYIQKLIGYLLTGDTDIHAFWFLFGTGNNGKTTFTSFLRMFLKDELCCQMDKKAIMKGFAVTERGYETHFMALKNKRVLLIPEVTRDDTLDDGLIKRITGGDLINGRNLYEAPQQFSSTVKMILDGNTKPKIDDLTDGVWRRIRLIPFKANFSNKQRRDQSEILEELKKELPGIFNWAIEGLKMYQKEGGLKEPEIMKKDALEYREDSDTFKGFINEVGENFENINEYLNNFHHISLDYTYNPNTYIDYDISSINGWTPIKTITEAYNEYCQRNNIYKSRRLGERELQKRLKSEGYSQAGRGKEFKNLFTECESRVTRYKKVNLDSPSEVDKKILKI